MCAMSWALVCAISIVQGPLGKRAHMICLFAVYSAMAVTYMQRHEHRLSAKLSQINASERNAFQRFTHFTSVFSELQRDYLSYIIHF